MFLACDSNTGTCLETQAVNNYGMCVSS